jgi:hypothetical protein
VPSRGGGERHEDAKAVLKPFFQASSMSRISP